MDHSLLRHPPADDLVAAVVKDGGGCIEYEHGGLPGREVMVAAGVRIAAERGLRLTLLVPAELRDETEELIGRLAPVPCTFLGARDIAHGATPDVHGVLAVDADLFRDPRLHEPMRAAAERAAHVVIARHPESDGVLDHLAGAHPSHSPRESTLDSRICALSRQIHGRAREIEANADARTIVLNGLMEALCIALETRTGASLMDSWAMAAREVGRASKAEAVSPAAAAPRMYRLNRDDVPLTQPVPNRLPPPEVDTETWWAGGVPEQQAARRGHLRSVSKTSGVAEELLRRRVPRRSSLVVGESQQRSVAEASRRLAAQIHRLDRGSHATDPVGASVLRQRRQGMTEGLVTMLGPEANSRDAEILIAAQGVALVQQQDRSRQPSPRRGGVAGEAERHLRHLQPPTAAPRQTY